MESNNKLLEQWFCEIAQYHLGDKYIDYAAVLIFSQSNLFESKKPK